MGKNSNTFNGSIQSVTDIVEDKIVGNKDDDNDIIESNAELSKAKEVETMFAKWILLFMKVNYQRVVMLLIHWCYFKVYLFFTIIVQTLILSLPKIPQGVIV